jgi:hypothetical protein
MNPKISVIIVNDYTEANLEHCLRSLHVATGQVVEIILVDNSPGRGAEKILKYSGLPGHYFPQAETLNFSQAANFGAQHASGEFLCFLAPTTILEAKALDRLINWTESHPRTVAGPRELDQHGRPLITVEPFITRRHVLGVHLLSPYTWVHWLRTAFSWLVPVFRFAHLGHHATHPQRVPILSGSCLVMSRSIWHEVGEWHEELAHFGLTSEWFERARDFGVTAWYIPEAVVWHELLPVTPHSGSTPHGRAWFARRFGIVTMIFLTLVVWIEHRLRLHGRN